MQSNFGHNDHFSGNDANLDIGHLISVSSYHAINSPWASSLNYYSRSITETIKNTSPKNDLNVEQQKPTFLEIAPDAFRPVELPTTKKAAARTSQLSSLFAGKNTLSSPSLKNIERRMQQYGNDDSITAYPEIGEGIRSRTTSSARLQTFNYVDTSPHEEGYEDKEDKDGQHVECRYGSGHYDQDIDADESWTRGADHRDDHENDNDSDVIYSVSNMDMNTESTRSNNMRPGEFSRYSSSSSSCQSKRIGWTAAPTGEFQDIISVAKYHTDSSINTTTAFEPPTKAGLQRMRNASSNQLEAMLNPKTKERSYKAAEHSSPSQNTFDPRNRATHPPLVSAMRKKNLSSTETAVARVRVASSAVHSGMSSDSEDSSDEDDDDDTAFMTTGHTHESSENKEDSQELWRTVPSVKSKACFNFDLSMRQKSMMQRTKEKDKEKARKTRGGVRFSNEGEFPPVFPASENIMPYEPAQNTVTRPTAVEEEFSGSTTRSTSEKSEMNETKAILPGKSHRNSTEKSSILEVVSTAIEMLFSSSRLTTPATSVSPSPSSTPYLSHSLPEHLQHTPYKQRSHFV